jgi:PIN domain nuclease of toxin-antitoxin system
MRYLLDTHILLWMLEDDGHLSASILDVVTDRNNTLFVSAASLFEIAIKTKIGKLDTERTSATIVQEMNRLAIELLPVLPDHLDAYQAVPLFDDHRDPFDRLLIATALSEKLDLISVDSKFKRYTNLITLIQ